MKINFNRQLTSTNFKGPVLPLTPIKLKTSGGV